MSSKELKPQPAEAMADRYYQMAETMNQRGAMELAVPFYRQAVALLLAEREALQHQLGRGETAKPQSSALPADDLHGLLEAAQVLSRDVSISETIQPALSADLERHISELEEELSADSAQQVMAGLHALAASHQQSLPSSGVALLGKTQMLLGQPLDGLKSFEAALAIDPENRSFQINVGAARLAVGDLEGSLNQLRAVWNGGTDALEPELLSALFRNLSTAEARAGHQLVALQLRRRWLGRNPEAVSPARWLQWAQQGLDAQQVDPSLFQESLEFMKELSHAYPDERNIKSALAETLEASGDYREAALLFRDLLKS